jgi:hypothetical protein
MLDRVYNELFLPRANFIINEYVFSLKEKQGKLKKE